MFNLSTIVIVWLVWFSQVRCMKRKKTPTQNELLFDKKLKMFHSKEAQKQISNQPKQFKRTKSLPKQDIPGIFHNYKIEKQKQKIDENLNSAQFKLYKKEEMIRDRFSYAPITAKNRSQMIKLYETSEKRDETARVFKIAAQNLLYRSKQLENLNKDRLKLGKEPLKSIPLKIKKLEGLSGLFIERSKANKIASDEAKEEYYQELDKSRKLLNSKYIQQNEDNDHKDEVKMQQKPNSIYLAHEKFMDKHQSYFSLPKTRGELIKERAKSVA